MKTKKNAVEAYCGRLRVLCMASGGLTALCVAVETLLWVLSVLGIVTPESVLHTVNTHILGSGGYKIVAFVLAALTVFLALRYSHASEEGKGFHISAIALAVRECTLAVTALAGMALGFLGIGGGVDPLISPDGYLVRMVEPILNVLSGAVVLVFSVVYLCVYLAALRADET